MQLLVSVRDPVEARTAVAAGADIIDAKEPGAGALGCVPLPAFREIVEVVARQRPVSAALGDADGESATEQRARVYACAGASFVKIGFAGIADADDLERFAAAAVRGAVPVRAAVIGVAYADHDRAGALAPDVVLDAILRARAQGILLDTYRKDGAGVRQRVTDVQVRAWVRRAQSAGLIVAVAGQLALEDLPAVADWGVNIVGVRGAACEAGREGRLSAARVRALSESLRRGAIAGLP